MLSSARAAGSQREADWSLGCSPAEETGLLGDWEGPAAPGKHERCSIAAQGGSVADGLSQRRASSAHMPVPPDFRSLKDFLLEKS